MDDRPPSIPLKPSYKIGEVCQYTDTQPYVLRFWESEFPQLAPEKSRSGQRVYRRQDIDLIFRIKKLLYEEEYTIAGARKKLDQEGNAAEEVEAETTGVPERHTRRAPRVPDSDEDSSGAPVHATAPIANDPAALPEEVEARIRQLELALREAQEACDLERERRRRALARLEAILVSLTASKQSD